MTQSDGMNELTFGDWYLTFNYWLSALERITYNFVAYDGYAENGGSENIGPNFSLFLYTIIIIYIYLLWSSCAFFLIRKIWKNLVSALNDAIAITLKFDLLTWILKISAGFESS